MPVIEINALPQKEGVDIPKVIGQVATSVAEIAGVPEHAVFCTWNEIRPGFYKEGPNTAERQPDGTHPPIVRLTMFEGRTQQTIEQAIEKISAVLQDGLGMGSANAFISYYEAKSGQIFTGGKLKR